MTQSLSHRGPDGSGFHFNEKIGLGHRRLSIIDIGGGAQPIYNEDRSQCVVFNGEIYNFVELRSQLVQAGHVFKTRSDTEVIVHAYEQWGTECVQHFNGMFAFAIWDEKRNRLFVARDHLGVKPVYYTIFNKQFRFASEVKSILEDKDVPRAVNIEALGDLFTFRFVPAPRTLFQGINKLPAGHYLTADESGIKVQRYWQSIPRHRSSISESALIDEYQSLVEDAVRLQLRSDVPVGLFLSSGVDSGCLLALMRKNLTDTIHTYTIGFEGGELTNENQDARNMAQRFETQHQERIISPRDYLEYYEKYMWDLEEPVGNESAAAFHFVSQLASKDVKVALTGQGADEPWAGYHRYLGLQLSDYYRRIPGALRDRLIKPLIYSLPGNERLKRGVSSLDESDVLTRFTKIYSFFSQDMRAQLFNESTKEKLGLSAFEAKKAIAQLQSDVSYLDPVSQMLYIDTRASLPDDLLMVSDKTSMANSIETRVPFLDKRLVEFVESLPLKYKLRRGSGKYLHKKATEKWLPNQVVYRKKKGFANPVDKWLRVQMRSHIDSRLFDPASCIGEYFDLGYIREIVRKHETGQENYMRHIYLLISFEMWHRKYIRGL